MNQEGASPDTDSAPWSQPFSLPPGALASPGSPAAAASHTAALPEDRLLGPDSGLTPRPSADGPSCSQLSSPENCTLVPVPLAWLLSQ